MRNTNCQNIRREIEEAGSADLLGVAATSHIQGCAACAKVSQQQTRLQEIVAGLGTVEAPGDFDFRLRARLAGERPSSARAGSLTGFSFGLRPAAVMTMLLLMGAMFVFFSARTRPVAPVVSKAVETPKAGASDVKPNQGAVPTSAGVPSKESAVAAVKSETNPPVGGLRPVDRGTRGSQNELAANRGSRSATRDISLTPAPVLKRDDALAASYPTAAFPINASYQSLKVSVDDGRGTSRTISLPSVSFGSDRTISQNPSPLMAAARGSW